MIKIASVTLSSNREHLVRDAAESVKGLVDFAVVVDLGITDGTLDVMMDVLGRDKVYSIKADPDAPTGTLRNIGIAYACDLGADWAITLDTDERIVHDGSDIRGCLEATEADILLAEAITGGHASYHKERMFRLPMKDRFERHIHECVVPKNSRVGRIDGIKFKELAKTGEAFEAKMKLIIDSLTAELERDPSSSRNWFYLGDAYEGTKEWDKAFDAFKKCVSLKGWNEEAAWACLRMATICERKGNFEEAIDCCMIGLGRNAGMPELAFYAAILNLGLGRVDQAIYWCRMAIPNGKLGGQRELAPRMAWKIDYAMSRGPWEILRDCYKAIGWHEEEMECIRMLEPMAQ